MKPKPGEMVVLIEIPRGMLDDLPPEDQEAITDVVGKPILLNEYDDAGRAELEFKDRDGQIHFISSHRSSFDQRTSGLYQLIVY